uniref:Uncharacterized protein n=1 Tax=Saccharolobus solfataricus (strain 98/2) TaxID=555311 RepID=D0KNJ4_SACS9
MIERNWQKSKAEKEIKQEGVAMILSIGGEVK